LRCGASMVNDISALRSDPQMASVVAEAGVPVILMHMKGTPSDMQVNPSYDDVVEEIITFLKEVRDQAVSRGVRRERIILDPGIGFGKTFDHNLEILKDLSRFQCLETPILVGSSRKAFIGRILDKKVHERDTGTMATVAAAVMNGAHIVRVHNVKQAAETVKVIDAIKRGGIEGV
ncbi:MAG TPA: dihydropteroate synthase, partial [Desulfatiglandales bacterium]|nr:dihydropteroate synthase [Desulfatiglandales bacterium]